MVSAAGNVDSRNCASPVTSIFLLDLSHSLHALAFDSMPTKIYLLAIGPTLDFRCLSCA